MIASPLTPIQKWHSRIDQADLYDLVLLGFTVDLPFLEKVAVPTARAVGTQITVLGDAAHGLYDPVDVHLAGRAYFHGLASCGGAFHPKLALLVGEHDMWAAIGSGNPTKTRWGHSDELWTVLRGDNIAAPAGLVQLGHWLGLLPQVVRVLGHIGELLRAPARGLTALPDTADSASDTTVLHNLHVPLLSQLPHGPVDELCLYAPFVDPSGTTLREIVARLDPGRVVIGVQERWSSYDGDVIAGALRGCDAELRLLVEQTPRHGKLVEWESGGRRYALTDSANLTASALTRSTSVGGNCGLAVLAPATDSLMPSGETVRPSVLSGRRTVAQDTPTGRGPVLLGALLTARGFEVTLARPHGMPLTVETSPSGAPGSWTAVGTVHAGETVRVFTVGEPPGTVVRAVETRPDGSRTQSPPVFTVRPGRCARRRADDDRPKLQRVYTEDEIFTDPEMAERFRNDLLRLSHLIAEERGRSTAAQPARTPVRPEVPTPVDRWEAYLEERERAVGAPLVRMLFGTSPVGLSDIPEEEQWGLSVSVTVSDSGEGAEEPGPEEGNDSGNTIPTTERPSPETHAAWRKWIPRAVNRAAPEFPGTAASVLLRGIVARIFIQLLWHGVWALDDGSWRADLARLTQALPPHPDENIPEEAQEHLRVLTAVCMGLLRLDASLTGGTPNDLLARQTWQKVREFVAHADPDLAERAGTALVYAEGSRGWVFLAWSKLDLVWISRPRVVWKVHRLTVGTPASLLGSTEMSEAGQVGRSVRVGRPLPESARRLLTDAGLSPEELLDRLVQY